MSTAWKNLEGHVVDGVLPLLRCIASSDRSGVFLTESAKHAPAALALKLVRVDPTSVDAQPSRLIAAADLSHPHLIPIFEAGHCTIGELPFSYALMEYADQSLAQLLEQRALTEPEAREMLEPTLSTLAYLHERKFALGRLKPSNVLAVGDQLKLASDAVHAVGWSSGIMNTASAYDAPEARGGICSAAGDIWALGVTLCEALTRQQPSGLNAGVSEVDLPSELRPPFREIVARCLNRDPRKRPKVAEIQAWLRGEHSIGAETAAPGPATTPSRPSATIASAADPPAAAEPAVAQAAEVETTESRVPPATAAKSQPDTTSKLRLVIRAEILPDEPPRTTILPRVNKRALGLVLGAISALALGWIAIDVFRIDGTSAPDPNAGAQNMQPRMPAPAPAPSESARAGGDALPPEPTTSTRGTGSTETTSVAPSTTEPTSTASTARAQADASASPVKEMIPNVPQSALQTIRGTVRVAIRVTIGKEGNVLAAASEIAGPSRYFERLSLEAAKKWTFTPADAQEQRTMRVRFYFTRAGVTAGAEPVR